MKRPIRTDRLNWLGSSRGYRRDIEGWTLPARTVPRSRSAWIRGRASSTCREWAAVQCRRHPDLSHARPVAGALKPNLAQHCNWLWKVTIPDTIARDPGKVCLDFAHSRGTNPGMANHHCA